MNKLVKWLAIASISCFSLGVQAAATPFSTDVTAAVDDGLQWLRTNGAFSSNNSDRRQARGLTLLALLEKRESADINAEPVGYANSLPADQTLARTAMDLLLGDTSYGAARASFYAYSDGENLMAISLYALTGGPEIAGRMTLREAMDRLTTRTLDNQTTSNVVYKGMWGYTGNGNDSSTTQFAIAGLASAKTYYLAQGDAAAMALVARIDAATALAAEAYARNAAASGTDGKGHGYRSTGYTPSYAQTASGTWVQLLGGAGLNDTSVQDYLTWLRTNYNYLSIEPARNFWRTSYHYYLWSSSKAYSLIDDSGTLVAPGNISTADMGTLPAAAIMLDRAGQRLTNRDPVTDVGPRDGVVGKYASETPRWYYDYAYSLMTEQDAAGRFTSNTTALAGGYNHGQWNLYSSQAYAILVLERSIGGACLDSDSDGICDSEDNCPADANPDQMDTDGDGIGDICDAPDTCDANGDFHIDKLDIRLISAARGTVALPGDVRDANGDGIINGLDARICVGSCDLARCAIAP